MPVDPAAVERLLSWDGIGRSFIRRFETFEAAARSSAPFRPDAPGPHLVDTIDHTLDQEGTALTARVGCNPHQHLRGYAWMVHQGTQPHPILPHRPPRFLKFKVAGRIVYATRVAHPGTTPDPFLTRHLKEITG